MQAAVEYTEGVSSKTNKKFFFDRNGPPNPNFPADQQLLLGPLPLKLTQNVHQAQGHEGRGKLSNSVR